MPTAIQQAAAGLKVMAPPRMALKLPPSPPRVAAPTPGSQHTPKKFSVTPWSDSDEGTKILAYAANGMGKTTLGSMAPDAVFIGLDDGGRKIRNPKTGKLINAILGVQTFQDLRDAIQQPGLLSRGQTLVLDNATEADALGVKHVLSTIKTEKGETCYHLEDYGYGKGFNYLTDTMRLLVSDLDPLVRRGVNVLLLAQQGQATVANLEGTDYIQDGPLLTAQPKAGANVRNLFTSWVDYIFKIGYPPVEVVKANLKAQKGKASGSTTRVIYAAPEVYFVAKNRPVNGQPFPDAVTFDRPDDDSLWQFLFPGRA